MGNFASSIATADRFCSLRWWSSLLSLCAASQSVSANVVMGEQTQRFFTSYKYLAHFNFEHEYEYKCMKFHTVYYYKNEYEYTYLNPRLCTVPTSYPQDADACNTPQWKIRYFGWDSRLLSVECDWSILAPGRDFDRYHWFSRLISPQLHYPYTFCLLCSFSLLSHILTTCKHFQYLYASTLLLMYLHCDDAKSGPGTYCNMAGCQMLMFEKL